MQILEETYPLLLDTEVTDIISYITLEELKKSDKENQEVDNGDIVQFIDSKIKSDFKGNNFIAIWLIKSEFDRVANLPKEERAKFRKECEINKMNREIFLF
jgi:hypothetical protein